MEQHIDLLSLALWSMTQGESTRASGLLLPDTVVPACQAAAFHLPSLCQHFPRPEPATWHMLAGTGRERPRQSRSCAEGPAPTAAA